MMAIERRHVELPEPDVKKNRLTKNENPKLDPVDTVYDCACGNKGRGIGLITSKLLTNKEATGK